MSWIEITHKNNGINIIGPKNDAIIYFNTTKAPLLISHTVFL